MLGVQHAAAALGAVGEHAVAETPGRQTRARVVSTANSLSAGSRALASALAGPTWSNAAIMMRRTGMNVLDS